MRKDTRLSPLFHTASNESWVGPGNEVSSAPGLGSVYVYISQTAFSRRLQGQNSAVKPGLLLLHIRAIIFKLPRDA